MIIFILYKEFSINGKIYNISPIGDKIYTNLNEARDYMKKSLINKEDIKKFEGYRFEAIISSSIKLILEPLQTFISRMSKPNTIYYPSYNFNMEEINLPPFSPSMIERLKDNIKSIDGQIKDLLNINKDIDSLIYSLLYKLDNTIVDNEIIINLDKDLELNKDIIRSIIINIMERNTSTIFTICLFPQML